MSLVPHSHCLSARGQLLGLLVKETCHDPVSRIVESSKFPGVFQRDEEVRGLFYPACGVPTELMTRAASRFPVR